MRLSTKKSNAIECLKKYSSMQVVIKRVPLIILCTILSINSYSNTIDSLNTKRDVDIFLTKYFGRVYGNIERHEEGNSKRRGVEVLNSSLPFSRASIFRFDSNWDDTIKMGINNNSVYTKQLVDASKTIKNFDYINEYRSNSFYKVDLDCNGKTDIIVDGRELLIVMDFENEKKIYYIDGTILPTIPNTQHYLLYNYNVILPDGTRGMVFRHETAFSSCKLDTLIWGACGFVEYNCCTKTASISKIRYSKESYIYNDRLESHNFEIELDRTGHACLHREQNYSTLLNAKSIDSIWIFMSQIDVISKENNYYSDLAHGSNFTFTIYFDSGDVKVINANGTIGTIGLGSLEKKLTEVSVLPIWKNCDSCILNK